MRHVEKVARDTKRLFIVLLGLFVITVIAMAVI